MSLYLLAKKAKLKEQARIYNSKNPFALSWTNTGSSKSKCVSNLDSRPIVQTGYGIRNKRLTTTNCGCNIYKKMPDTSTRQYLEEKKGDHIYTSEKNATTDTKSFNSNCSTSNSSSGTNGKSLNSTMSRFKNCTITKDPPVARSAGQQIEKVRARIATCAAANPKPTLTTRCRTTG